jgi:hypothetical protein
VRPARGRPIFRDPRGVCDVERHHDPPLFGGKLQQPLVIPSVELALLVGSPHIVPLAQRRRDPARRDMRVEETASRSLLADSDSVDRRIPALKLSERTRVLNDRRVDFLWKLAVVGERQPDL